MLKKHKNPKGGLTEAGRKFFKKKEGANLKPIASQLNLYYAALTMELYTVKNYYIMTLS